MKNNPYIRRASIWRILTTSTLNVISILFLLFLLSQLFLGELPHLYLKVIVIGLILGDLALIASITLVEYRYSFFVIEDNKISYYQPLNKKKSFEKSFTDIKQLRIVSSSLLIEFDDRKVLLDYLAKPKHIQHLIQEKRVIA